MFKKKLLLRALVAAGLTTGLAACGGGSSSSSSDDTSSDSSIESTETSTGQFVDSPVQGLRYFTSSGSGVTTVDGEYEYQNGEEIYFLVGKTLIGQSVAGTLLTPLDMAGDAKNANKSLNILRFLQTLDDNGNLSDGITISDKVIALAEAQTSGIDFDIPTEEFAASQDVQSLVAEAGKDALVTSDSAIKHFETTLKTLASNEIDIRGEWIATSVYKQNGQTLCTGKATWTYTSEGLSVSGEELNPDTTVDPVDCGIEQLSFSGAYSSAELADPGMGCTGGVCFLNQLNTVIPKWDEEGPFTYVSSNGETISELKYSVVELSHRLGSDTMRRVKTDFQESTNETTGETSKQVFGVFDTTYLMKEASEYTKDMRGTWEITATRSSCPAVTAVHTITYSDTGITAVGEELNVVDGSCVIANMNESLAYDDPELPAEFCGPVCSYSELNGTYSDEGETIKLSHKRDTNKINRTKGLDSQEIWVKTN